MFIETARFPDDVAKNATFSPEFRTQKIELSSGKVITNRSWEQPLFVINVSFKVRHLDDLTVSTSLRKVYNFYMSVGGGAIGFRVKNWLDYKSTLNMSDAVSGDDQVIGTGDDTTTQFQLVKRYTEGGIETIKTIEKPVDGTVIFHVNGVPQPGTVDYTTGVVTMGIAPALGDIVSAGFEYDLKCRFAKDTMPYNLNLNYVGSVSGIVLEEYR